MTGAVGAPRCELPAPWSMAVTGAGAEPAEVGYGHGMSVRLLHSRAARFGTLTLKCQRAGPVRTISLGSGGRIALYPVLRR